MTNDRYRQAMKCANDFVKHLSENNEIWVPKLMQQINRDFLFQEFSNDFTNVRSRVSFLDIFASLKNYIILTFQKVENKEGLCLNPNLFNYQAACQLKAKVIINQGLILDRVCNPLLWLKYVSLLLACIRILRPRTLKRMRKFHRIGIHPKYFLIYLQQIIHFRLSRRLVSHLVYSGNGAPSYGRYLCDGFWELQHGVVHSDHPSVNTIARSRGALIVLNEFGLDIDKGSYVTLSQTMTSFFKTAQMTIGLPPLRGERHFEEHFRRDHSNSLLLYHPKSKNAGKIHTSDKYLILKNADVIISGFGTTIFDIHELNPAALHVMVSSMELKDLGWDNLDHSKIADKINRYFDVSISPGRIKII